MSKILPEVFKIKDKVADHIKLAARPATTNPMGAGTWKPLYNQYFDGKQVVILPDRDGLGESHAENVARNLFPH